MLKDARQGYKVPFKRTLVLRSPELFDVQLQSLSAQRWSREQPFLSVPERWSWPLQIHRTLPPKENRTCVLFISPPMGTPSMASSSSRFRNHLSQAQTRF